MERYRSRVGDAMIGRMESVEEFEDRRAREKQARIDAFAQGATRIARGEGAPQPPVVDGYFTGSTDSLDALKARIQYLNERS